LAAERCYEQAAQLFGAAAATRCASGLELAPSDWTEVDRVSGTVRAALGETAFAAACARGGELTLDAARVLATEGG
jgi:hypothetical protein